ncbi:hypothetical protein C8D74_102168 [Petrotoga sibirica]|uniref:Peptidase M1 membrane alanine aminopeptidase domain-containing protein n=2 Tax=Petrotoga sibirica TaxID=156202 RepID=A0A4R8EX14_9BACT|nr:hypothetical protein C8D74_102168 [Petrotoga sibirica]
MIYVMTIRHFLYNKKKIEILSLNGNWIDFHDLIPYIPIEDGDQFFLVLFGKKGERKIFVAYYTENTIEWLTVFFDGRDELFDKCQANIVIEKVGNELTLNVQYQIRGVNIDSYLILLVEEKIKKINKISINDLMIVDYQRFGPFIIVAFHEEIRRINLSYILVWENVSSLLITSQKGSFTLPIWTIPCPAVVKINDSSLYYSSNHSVANENELFFEDIRNIVINIETEPSNFQYSYYYGSVISNVPLKDKWDYKAEITKIIQYYEDHFKPLKYLHISTYSGDIANAVSFSHLILFRKVLLASPETLLFSYLPHEIAHQWFGNNIKFMGKGALLLTETIAEHLQLLYDAYRFGHSFLERRLNWYKKNEILNNKFQEYAFLLLKWHDMFETLGTNSYFNLLNELLCSSTQTVQVDEFLSRFASAAKIDIQFLVKLFSG